VAANPIKITDTTFRDAHQSLLATRLRTADMEPIATELDSMGFHSMEVWGGATFDSTTRFLAEDPWERLRTFKKLIPNTPLMMLLRGQSLVGYRAYADDVVDAFVQRSAEVGIDIFRVFDALNDTRNLQRAADAVKKNGKHLQMTICYSVTEGGKLGGPIFNRDYFLEKAASFRDLGADSICLKDMAGLLAPYDAYELFTALRPVVGVPLHLHTHYTSGMASMTALKAIEAGVDVVDTCLAPLALRTSQPAVEPLTVTLKGTERDSGLDLEKLLRAGDYLESMLPKYRDQMESPRAAVIDAKVLSHQIPGGMASNLISQLREADGLDRLDEVLAEIPRVREDLGFPPLVTPMSQMVGTQSVTNVLFGRYKMMSGQLKDYLYGLYGQPPSPPDPELVERALKDYERGQEPITDRPADLIDPEMDQAREAVKDISTDIDDVLIYALYPTTGMKFLRIKHGLDPVPDEMKPRTLEQVNQEKAAKAKPAVATVAAPPQSPAARLFNVYVGEQSYQVAVDPVSATGVTDGGVEAAAAVGPAPAEVAQPQAASGQVTVTAPMPGIILRYAVEVGQSVQEGDPVVVMEAMKMENTLPAPISGKVASLPLEPGATVVKDDVLATIAP
jgi:pyruvate carboxylase subunit B